MMENGFLISIMLTILLAGLTFYYIKRVTSKTERKLTSMFQLIQSITTELNKINEILVNDNSDLKENSTEKTSSGQDDNYSCNTQCQLNKENDSCEISNNDSYCCTTQCETENNIELLESPVETIHTIEITAVSLPEDKTKVIELKQENSNDSDSDSDSDSDESELDTETDEENIQLEVIKTQQTEDNRIEITEPNAEEKKDNLIEEVTEEIEKKTLNIVDYNKLQVRELREIVQKKGLITDAKKLKKKELLEMLR